MAKPFSFGAQRKEAEESGLLGSGDYYKYKNGDNRFRLMSECLPHTSSYKGQKSFKWLCYVLDRRDGKVRTHFMPHTVYKSIEALQENPDYTFDGVPMPYDITVHAKNAGTKEAEYTVLPARKETPLSRDEEADLAAQKPLRDVQAALQAKSGAADNGASSSHDEPPPLTDDDINFR